MKAATTFTTSSIAFALVTTSIMPKAMKTRALKGPENLLLYPNVIIFNSVNA